MKFLQNTLIIGFLTLGTHISQADQALSIGSVEEILKAAKTASTPIQSVDEFLKAMQDKNGGRFKNFTLMKTSENVQGADCLNPRAIVTSDDGKFIFSFTRNQQGQNKIEMIQFDDKTKKYMPYELEFPSKETVTLLGKNSQPILKGPEVVQKKCLGCHGGDEGMGFVPIWEPFPEWKNAYGSVNNHLDTKQGPPPVIRGKGADPKYFIDIMNREKAYLEVIAKDKAGTMYDVLDFEKDKYPYPLENTPKSRPPQGTGNGQLLLSLNKRVNESIRGKIGTQCLAPHKIYLFMSFCINVPQKGPVSAPSVSPDSSKWNAYLNSILDKKYISKDGDYFQKALDKNGNDSGELDQLYLKDLDGYKALAAAGIPNPRERLSAIPGLYPGEGRLTNGGAKVDLKNENSIRANPKGCYPDLAEAPKDPNFKIDEYEKQLLDSSVAFNNSIGSLEIFDAVEKLCEEDVVETDKEMCLKLKNSINSEIESQIVNSKTEATIPKEPKLHQK